MQTMTQTSHTTAAGKDHQPSRQTAPQNTAAQRPLWTAPDAVAVAAPHRLWVRAEDQNAVQMERRLWQSAETSAAPQVQRTLWQR